VDYSKRSLLLNAAAAALVQSLPAWADNRFYNAALDASFFGVLPGSGDVTTALQRAVDTAAEQGRDVFIPANKQGEPYILLGMITIPARVAIRSVAAEAAEFRCSAKTVFKIIGPRVSVYGLRFISTQKEGGATAISLATATGNKIELVTIEGCGTRHFSFAVRDDAEAAFRMDSIDIKNNAFQAMGENGAGVLLRNIAGSIYIRDNMVSFLRSARSGTGYIISNGGGVKFSSHAIGNFDEGADERNVGAKFINCTALWLNGSNIENFGGAGIVLDNCYAVRGWGNHAGANDGPGIEIKNSTTINLQTTTIRGNAASKGALAPSHGLHILGNSSEIVIDGIRIHETTGDAVHIDASNSNIVVNGLIVSKERSVARVQGNGLVSAGHNVTLTHSSIDACNGYGLVADGTFHGDNVYITDCAAGRVFLKNPTSRLINWPGEGREKFSTLSGPVKVK